MQQKFSGEYLNGDTFEDWIEQFEMVAKLYKWSEAAKLRYVAKKSLRPCCQVFAKFRETSNLAMLRT